MEFKIETLTPIWTGDVNRTCKTLRETSLVGSLRWWFEVIVRGFGYYACDPTSENNRCKYDGNVNSICPVCQIFGCTGWSRRFRLEVNQNFRKIYEGNLRIKGENNSWYYPSGVMSCNGEYNRFIKTLSGGEYLTDEEYGSIIKILLKFISDYGMVGGKTAIGYGVVKFEGKDIKVDKEDFENLFNYLNKKKSHGKNSNNMPILDEMFFAKFKINSNSLDKIIEKVYECVDDNYFPKSIYKCNGTEEKINNKKEFLKKLRDYYSFIPTSALIRKELRKRIKEKWINNTKLRHFLMGYMQKNKKLAQEDPTRFSAIQVSHIYNTGEHWEFRIWGWIPKNLDKKFDVQREEVIDFLMLLLNNQEDDNSNRSNEEMSKGFWESIFGDNCVEKINGNYIIKYSDNENNWNSIDFGDLENLDERKKAFESMLRG